MGTVGTPLGGATLHSGLRVGAVMLDQDGTVLLVGPIVGEMLHRTTAETVGTPFEEYVAKGPGVAEVRAVVEREGHWRGLVRLRRRDGGTVELALHASLAIGTEGRSYLVLNLVDTVHLRTLERRLAGLDALFDHSPVGIALFDTEQRYVHVNQALAHLNGHPVDEHLGRTVYELLPDEVARAVDRLQRTVLRTGRPVVDVVVPAADGGTRSVSYNRLTDVAGNVIGISCLVLDNTSRREALNKVERARERLLLLDDIGVAIGEHLDAREIAQSLASSLVPRFTDHADVLLFGEVLGGGELPGHGAPPHDALRHAGTASRAAVRREVGDERFPFDPESVLGKVLAGGRARIIDSAGALAELVGAGASGIGAACDPDVHSVLALPLRARGLVLGLLVLGRADGTEPFDRDDLALATEFAGRSGVSIDNARLYARERDSALMLQRSLLPSRFPDPVGVSIASSYVPAASGAEVGGDWFDVIPLAGGRVAFVIGDVMGHGLRAAATMGRLRTAVRTLAGLDLAPDEVLRRVGELGDDLAEEDGDTPMATCVYAVYEPAPTVAPHLAERPGARRRGLLTVANAGHLPPLLVKEDPDGRRSVRELRLPSGTPLSVGGVPFESVQIEVEEGTVLVLYTDGLVEDRERPLGEGLARLRAEVREAAEGLRDEISLTPGTGLARMCTDVLEALDRGPGTGDEADGTDNTDNADDVALLLARLGGLPTGAAEAWTFSPEERTAGDARRSVRATLRGWGLSALEDAALLLVSELVTNALRYAEGTVGLRMVRNEHSVVVEVADTAQDAPSERTAAPEDEGGRGLQLVAGAAHRWGTRRGPEGKTVWFELLAP